MAWKGRPSTTGIQQHIKSLNLKSKTRSAISLLPVELWDRVFSLIDDYKIASILPLRSVCHVFREIVESVFYESFHFTIRLHCTPLPGEDVALQKDSRSKDEDRELQRKNQIFAHFSGASGGIKLARKYTRRLHISLYPSTLSGSKPDLTCLIWLLDSCTNLVELVIHDTKDILLNNNDFDNLRAAFVNMKHFTSFKISNQSGDPCPTYYQWIRMVLSIRTLRHLSIPHIPPNNAGFMPPMLETGLGQMQLSDIKEMLTSGQALRLMATPNKWTAHWTNATFTNLRINSPKWPIIEELGLLGDAPHNLRHLSIPIHLGSSDFNLVPFKHLIQSLRLTVEERSSNNLPGNYYTHLDLRRWTSLEELSIGKKKPTVALGIIVAPAILHWALPLSTTDGNLNIRFESDDHYFVCDFLAQRLALQVTHMTGTITVVDYDWTIRFTKKTMDDRFLNCNRPLTENDTSAIILAYENVLWRVYQFQREASQENILFHPDHFLEDLRKVTELELQTFRLWRNQKFPILPPDVGQKDSESQFDNNNDKEDDNDEDEDSVTWNVSDIEYDTDDDDQDANDSDSGDSVT